VPAESLAAAKVKAHPERASSILVFSWPATASTKPTLLLDHGLAVLAVGDVLNRTGQSMSVERSLRGQRGSPKTAAAVRLEREPPIFFAESTVLGLLKTPE
jgi:hypothetical protein